MSMGLLDTQPPPQLSPTPGAAAVCRCGHCRAAIDVPEGRRRVRCRDCGWLNAIPARVLITCRRCNRGQHLRFSQRNGRQLCANCGHTLDIREIELTPLRPHTGRRASSHRRGGRRESIVFTLLLYGLVLLFFLLWFSRR